ncbi:MAG TPA: YecR family lipoprotein [Steroidobacteraceae bacterium]|nr:YecR family lipoprotein [Steroidobacteraceae bacterium]
MKNLMLAVLALTVSGCTTYKLWTETDSDQQAGMVQLSYEYRRFESPQVDERAAAEMAKERCKDWGYPAASRNGEHDTCIEGERDLCKKTRVTREYRCAAKGQ